MIFMRMRTHSSFSCLFCENFPISNHHDLIKICRLPIQILTIASGSLWERQGKFFNIRIDSGVEQGGDLHCILQELNPRIG